MQPFTLLQSLTDIEMEPDSATEGHSAERALVAAFLTARDDRSFHALYRRVTPYVYQFVLRLVGNIEADAVDVLQDVWVRAIRRLPDFRWESSLHTWMSGIAVNRCRELYKEREKRKGSLSMGEIEVASPVDPLPMKLDLEAAIAQLPNGYRLVLVLHDVEGYTHEEIAIRLGIEPGSSKSQLSRARRTLRRLLKSGGRE